MIAFGRAEWIGAMASRAYAVLSSASGKCTVAGCTGLLGFRLDEDTRKGER